ncbi:hypothetical protein FG91_03573 [Sphingopyxis sp. LC81]|nr:benenodin family lasso peptide [Sphingopyxis sp. LC81]KGB52296.1 hypothetical protein FG91_03573 [Sphingopyxis sp. LC81]
MNHEQNDGLIDLGAVTEETKGPGPQGFDTLGPQQLRGGISDE